MTDYYGDTYRRQDPFAEAYVFSHDLTTAQAEAMRQVEYTIYEHKDPVPVYVHQAEERALDFLRRTAPDPLPTDTASWGMSWTGVMEAISEGPQSHAGERKGGGRVPVWALACLFAGLVLIGFSMVGMGYLVTM